MINAEDFANFSIELVEGGYIAHENGESLHSKPVPFAKAVDLIRRWVNGGHFADIMWDMLGVEANDEIAALLADDESEDNVTETHICDEDAERAAYRQYVSDGIGDTDGWYVPESFEAWQAHYHREIGHTEPRTRDCELDECHAPQHEKVRAVQHTGLKPKYNLHGEKIGMKRGTIRHESICLDCAERRADAKKKGLVAA